MKPKLFGSSGIRGLANKEISITLSQRVGAALATMYEGGYMVVGRDARVTGPMLEAALVSGLTSCGADVVTVGLLPTPVIAWITDGIDADSGVAISASHNPPEYNGLKIFNKNGMSYSAKEQLILEEILGKEAYLYADWDGVGVVEETDAVEPYLNALVSALDLESELKVACDLFCGATCSLAPIAFRELGIEAEHINSVPDGKFPAGHPEPDEKSLVRLGMYMKARRLDIGFGFDGDGDRMMPVGVDGVMVSPDRLLAAYAGYEVERNNGGVVVTHVGASMSVNDMVEEAGGRVVRTPVGDSFITEAMAENKAVFGGEPVGSWVIPEIHMCPDGLLAALKLIEALNYTGENLRDFVDKVPEYAVERIKLECPEQFKNKAMISIAEEFDIVFKDVESVSVMDGVRLEMEEGWVLIRPSGTEPLIRITVEGRTRDNAEALMEKGKTLVKDILVKLK